MAVRTEAIAPTGCYEPLTCRSFDRNDESVMVKIRVVDCRILDDRSWDKADIQPLRLTVRNGSVAVSRTSESERRRWPNPSSHHRVLADQGPQSTGLRTDAPFRPTAIPPRRPLRGLRRRAARTLTLSPPLMPTRTAADRTSACFSAPKIPWQWPLDYRDHADAATESSVTKTHIFNAI